MSSIALFLNRDPVNNEITCFDKIVIQAEGDNAFKIVYRYEVGNSNRNVTSHFVYKNRDDLVSYISTCLGLLDKDHIPFYSIDLLIAGFPSVTYTPSDLSNSNTYYTIMNAIGKGIDIMNQMR